MTSIERQIAESGDDCRYQSSSSYFSLTAWQEVGFWDATYHGSDNGFRFINITVPKGAIIVSAYLLLKCRESGSQVVIRSRLKGEDIDTALIFTNVTDFLARDRTSAIVDWDGIEAFVLNTWYTSPDIKTIIQEIIDRAGWASGQDLVIFWDDEENRTDNVGEHVRHAYSYDEGAANAAKLQITYRIDYTVSISEIAGASESIGVVAAFKQAISEIAGAHESIAAMAARQIAISEIAGARDHIVTRKRLAIGSDLPDHTIQGGAKDE